jgi:hypothetical protein
VADHEVGVGDLDVGGTGSKKRSPCVSSAGQEAECNAAAQGMRGRFGALTNATAMAYLNPFSRSPGADWRSRPRERPLSHTPSKDPIRTIVGRSGSISR